jgi:regulator of telomere elongation helicase 1
MFHYLLNELTNELFLLLFIEEIVTQKQSTQLQSFGEILKLIFHVDLGVSDPVDVSQSYRVYLHREKQKTSSNQLIEKISPNSEKRILSYWCFNPGIAMQQITSHNPRSIILTSGTLAPLDSFALELKM